MTEASACFGYVGLAHRACTAQAHETDALPGQRVLEMLRGEIVRRFKEGAHDGLGLRGALGQQRRASVLTRKHSAQQHDDQITGVLGLGACFTQNKPSR